ncbi:hypothetical protein D3C86_1674230 [compost metagenome]
MRPSSLLFTAPFIYLSSTFRCIDFELALKNSSRSTLVLEKIIPFLPNMTLCPSFSFWNICVKISSSSFSEVAAPTLGRYSLYTSFQFTLTSGKKLKFSSKDCQNTSKFCTGSLLNPLYFTLGRLSIRLRCCTYPKPSVKLPLTKRPIGNRWALNCSWDLVLS